MVDIVARSEWIDRGTADVILSSVVRTVSLPDGATPVDLASAGNVLLSVDAHRSILTDPTAFRFVLRSSQKVGIDNAVVGLISH